MAEIVVTGGGVAGLSAAMVLAQDGHEVTLLERDEAAPPAPSEAWEAWERRGVNQFRLLHFFMPRFRIDLERELPSVAKSLEAAGALRISPIEGAPVELTGGVRAGDDDFQSLTARRPVVEAVVAAAAASDAGGDGAPRRGRGQPRGRSPGRAGRGPRHRRAYRSRRGDPG